MRKLNFVNKPVYDDNDNIKGQVEIKIREDTPPRYIIFNNVIHEYDANLQGYKKEEKVARKKYESTSLPH